MKRILWCLLLVSILTTSCNRKRTDEQTLPQKDNTEKQDTVFTVKKGSNGLEQFEDFIFEFSSAKNTQRQRVRFPLPVIADTDTTWIDKEQWNFVAVLADTDFYTLFFNDMQQMNMERNNELDTMFVNLYFLHPRKVKECKFERIAGEWFLTQESWRNFSGRSILDKFLDFYREFAADKIFQQIHISSPLRYITTDPDDDFNTIEGTLSAGQWESFKPQMPTEIVSNISYGQTFTNPRSMIMVKAGISNGLMDILEFKRTGSKWFLVSYEN